MLHVMTLLLLKWDIKVEIREGVNLHNAVLEYLQPPRFFKKNSKKNLHHSY